jgi:hypothetical protein
MLEGDQEAKEFSETAIITRVLIEIDPKVAMKKVKILSSIMESIEHA